MTIEIRDIIVNHPDLGQLQKQIIVYLNDNGDEVSKENYTEAHPLYGIDPNNLTRMDKFIINQLIGM